MLSEKWGHAEELLATQLELAAVARSEFLRANGVKSPPKPERVRRPWDPAKGRTVVKPGELFASMRKGVRRG